MAQKGFPVAAAGKPKRRDALDLDTPSEFGGVPNPAPTPSPDSGPGTDTEEMPEEGTGDVTLTLSREQASTLKDVLSQLSEQLGDAGSDLGMDTDMGADNDEDLYPLAGGPSSGGYGGR